MAFAQAQNALGNEDGSGSSNQIQKAFGSNTTAGNNIYVALGSLTGVTHDTVIGSSSGSATKRQTYTTTNGLIWTWWETQNIAGGADTITGTFSGNIPSIILIHEYSGGRTATQSFDKGVTKSDGASSTTLTGANVTPTVDNSLILAILYDASLAQAITGANGYTTRASSGTGLNVRSVELIQTTAASTHSDGTVASAITNYDVTTAVFMPPAASSVSGWQSWFHGASA